MRAFFKMDLREFRFDILSDSAALHGYVCGARKTRICLKRAISVTAGCRISVLHIHHNKPAHVVR